MFKILIYAIMAIYLALTCTGCKAANNPSTNQSPLWVNQP